MEQSLDRINGLVWGVPTLMLILGVGAYLSIRTGFAQIRLFPAAWRQFFAILKPEKESDGVSPFQSLCTALAATVGTGNLVGVAGAMALGGPGSIFWMWVCAIAGMVTKYAEVTLAVRFRSREKGELLGGPMYMIRNGLGRSWQGLGKLYCILGLLASFGVGNAAQINAVITGICRAAERLGYGFSRSQMLGMGILLALVLGYLLSGGAKRIGNTAQVLVPFVSCVYIALCIGVLFINAHRIPGAFLAIFRGACSPRAVTGGAVGSLFQTLQIGVSRGVFTNEAGMGTASIAHASAKTEHPASQGLMGIMEVFLDTVVICTMTALAILCSGARIPYGSDPGAALTVSAFCTVYGDWVSVLLAFSLCCFAFATVLGWGLYGIRCASFLFGTGSVKFFVLAEALTVAVSAVLDTGVIWSLAEIMNGLMAIPNLIALVGLSGELLRLTREFESNCGNLAAGGTYENFNQCKPLSAFPYAKIPPLRTGSQKTG